MSNNLKEKIIKNLDYFSHQEKKVAKYVVDNYENIATLSNGELGEKVGVSRTTVVRFAQTLGFKGYLKFKAALKAELPTVRSPYNAMRKMRFEGDGSIVLEYMTSIENDRNEFVNSLDMEAIEDIAQMMWNANRVYLAGVGSDKVVATYLENYLPLLGVSCTILIDEGLSRREKCLEMKSGDMVIMSAYPAFQESEFWLGEFCKREGIPLVLVTDSEVSKELIQCSKDIVIKSSLDTAFNSCVLTMMFCDILLLKVIEANPMCVEGNLKRYQEIVVEM